MVATVMMITRDQDLTADLVMLELEKRGVKVARLDLADVPSRLVQAAHLTPGAGWAGTVTGACWEVDLSNVRAVWWRKPAAYQPSDAMTEADQQWAAAEAEAGFGGVLTALGAARWINHPQRNAAADLKPVQLAVADRCGLAVPASLVTNDPEAARTFCREHRSMIYKPLRGGPGRIDGSRVALWATPVTAEDIGDDVAHTMHLFQERVAGAAVRMTVVGRRLFAARIDAPSGTVDWRAAHDQLTYTPVEVPEDVAFGVHRLMDHFGLVYAAPDWIVTPSGKWTFIGDLNPNGQWAWIKHSRLPIAAALADELSEML